MVLVSSLSKLLDSDFDPHGSLANEDKDDVSTYRKNKLIMTVSTLIYNTIK